MNWRKILHLLPTSALQAALSEREGVKIYTVDPGAQRTFKLCGPCIVTVNRD